MAWEELQNYVRSMRFLFTKSGATQVGSLVTFGSLFDEGWNWYVFLDPNCILVVGACIYEPAPHPGA